MDLQEAYKQYLASKNYEKSLECAAYLYQDGDDRFIRHFREEMGNVFQRTRNKNYLMYGKESYLVTARDKFEDYLIFTEWDRPYNEKFYLPRKRQLQVCTDSLQDLADDKLDILCISLPPGVGKSTLGEFYCTWLGGRSPKEGIVVGSHSRSILRGMYDECLRMMRNDEYKWKEVFPNCNITSTNAEDLKININGDRKFSSLQMGAAIGSDLAGKLRAIQLLYCDDLIPTLEEALSPERLDKKWQQYTVDLRQRKQGDKCKELHIATRWSVGDVIGRIESNNEGNDRVRIINIPALNENGESNFDYGGNIGFTTKFYMDLKRVMDEPSFNALYMGQPAERNSLLYENETLQRFYELPEGEPDSVISVCDTKDKGTDYCVMPIAYQYGDKFYITDFVCDNSNPEIVEPKLVDKLLRHKVKTSRFESNSAGGRIASEVQKKVIESGGITKIVTKYSTQNKETRIIVDSMWVKEHCLFLAEEKYTQEYRRAMNFLTSYSQSGKNKNDDVPDAMSMLANFAQSFETNTLVIKRRVF